MRPHYGLIAANCIPKMSLRNETLNDTLKKSTPRSNRLRQQALHSQNGDGGGFGESRATGNDQVQESSGKLLRDCLARTVNGPGIGNVFCDKGQGIRSCH